MSLQLRQIRKNSHLSQSELADKIQVSDRTVGSWERGITQMSAEQIYDCCMALSCDPNELLGWYLDHPEDAPGAGSPGVDDPDERRMVSAYRSMNGEGREAAANVVAGMVAAYPQKGNQPVVVEEDGSEAMSA